MTQHTPGPWIVETVTHEDGSQTIYVWHYWQEAEESGVDEICQVVMEYPAGILEANGRLIAAAPEMLALLQECRACVPAAMAVRIERLAARVAGEGQ